MPRSRLSELGKQRLRGRDPTIEGEVLPHRRRWLPGREHLISVRWDGNKRAHAIHPDFIEVLPEEQADEQHR